MLPWKTCCPVVRHSSAINISYGRDLHGMSNGEGKGREGEGREGKGREGKGREGKGREGKGREGMQNYREQHEVWLKLP